MWIWFFIKWIAFNLSNTKKGEVITKHVSKGNDSRSKSSNYLQLLSYGPDWGMRSTKDIFPKFKSCVLNDKLFHEVLPTLPENLVRSCDFNIFNGRGMHSTNPIDLIFERNRDIIIIHHPAKFHQNRSRTFWDNRPTHHTHTDRHTDTQTHTHRWK